MTVEIEVSSWDRLHELASKDHRPELEAYLASLKPSEIVAAVLRLEEDTQQKVLAVLSPDDAAAVIEDLPDEQAAELIERLSPADAASIVKRMQSDEQADLIADLDHHDAEAILREMAPEDAQEARELSKYADDVAGGLMVTEFLSFSGDITSDAALEKLKATVAEDPDYFTRYVYVVTKRERLIGVASVRELALQESGTPLADAMVPASFVEPETSFDDIKNYYEN